MQFKRVVKNIITIFLGVALFNGFMFLQQPSMVFFPNTKIEQTPNDWGLDFEEVYFNTEDGLKLHAWYIANNQAEKTLLFFHGNAGNISHRRSSIEIFHNLNLNVLIVDYRGYGKSEGNPSEQGFYKDATAAWYHLLDERGVDASDIIIFGRSLGGVVATELAARSKPAGLIVESTFSSARDMANAMLPLVSNLVFLRYDFNVLEFIQQVNAPVLVLHSPDDEIVPFRLGKKIFNAANEPKTFVEMRGGHNTGLLMSLPEYEQTLKQFIYTLD